MQSHREAVAFVTLLAEDFQRYFAYGETLSDEDNSCHKAGNVLDHKVFPAVHVGDADGRTPSTGDLQLLLL